jgi:hypothetical protein
MGRLHDASKVLMGGVKSSNRQVTRFDANPATFVAGLAARLKSDNTLSLAKADGRWLGVTLGKNLSDITAGVPVCHKGLGVPVLIEASPARLEITITNYANLTTGTEDTLQFEIDDPAVDETLTFKASASTEDEVAAASSNNQTATNLAAKINAHSVLGVHFRAVADGAVVVVTAKSNSILGEDIDATYVANSSVGLTLDDTTFTGGGIAPDYVVKGEKVYFSDSTGKADDPDSGATLSNAIYASGVLTGINEAGEEVYAALVDMPGGL